MKSRITKQEILRWHTELIERYGGDGGISGSTAECIEQSLGNATNGVHYLTEDSESARVYFACLMLVYLAKNHCFIDGNKRIAWKVFAEALAECGLKVQSTDDEVEAVVNEIASGSQDRDAVIAWVHSRLTTFQ